MASQVQGTGKTKAEANRNADNEATAYCNGGAWEEDLRDTKQEAPDYWRCDLYFNCK